MSLPEMVVLRVAGLLVAEVVRGKFCRLFGPASASFSGPDRSRASLVLERQVHVKNVRARSASDPVATHENPRRKRAVPFRRSVELPDAGGGAGDALSVWASVSISRH